MAVYESARGSCAGEAALMLVSSEIYLAAMVAVVLILVFMIARSPSSSADAADAAGAASGAPARFMVYPHLDLWDLCDVGGRGTYYGLMECRP